MKYRKRQKEELKHWFELLKKVSTEEEAKKIEKKIWKVWTYCNPQEINILMERGCDALTKKSYTKAIKLFSQVIAKNPSYAEAWNKRGLTYYLKGCFKQAEEDSKQTLLLEKRHFGALSCLASIYLMIGHFKGVFRVFHQLERIYPQREDIREQIQTLRKELKTKNF